MSEKLMNILGLGFLVLYSFVFTIIYCLEIIGTEKYVFGSFVGLIFGVVIYKLNRISFIQFSVFKKMIIKMKMIKDDIYAKVKDLNEIIELLLEVIFTISDKRTRFGKNKRASNRMNKSINKLIEKTDNVETWERFLKYIGIKDKDV